MIKVILLEDIWRKKKEKEKKVFLLTKIHCVVVPLTGQVPAVWLLLANWPLDFASHYEDIA